MLEHEKICERLLVEWQPSIALIKDKTKNGCYEKKTTDDNIIHVMNCENILILGQHNE